MYLKEQKKYSSKICFILTIGNMMKKQIRTYVPIKSELNFNIILFVRIRYGFERKFNVYECDDCSESPFRSSCTNAKDGNSRRSVKAAKRICRAKLSEERTHSIYGKRKVEAGQAFVSLKVNVRFTRFSWTGEIEG